MPKRKKRKSILCLDFDGVCNSYTSGWQGETNIPDGAVPGLFEFLEQVAPFYDIQVFSSRSATPEGIIAMQMWFERERRKWRKGGGGEGFEEVVEISFPATKPSASITLDDRAWTFNGRWPNVTSLVTFQPWHKQTQIDYSHTSRCQEWVMVNDCHDLIQCQLMKDHRDNHLAVTPTAGIIIRWSIEQIPGKTNAPVRSA